ncbi:MAG: peroxiredoxin [Ignavibacteriales bacterium]|nr:peroxiredoxin [Ignavibacteriales bacterium]MBK7981149.1 peroxiredoxin [Ignavibacteriota bacterium]
MLSIGQKFPEFNKLACVSIELGKEFGEVTSEDHKKDGKWMVMFWYPKDFTFVCPTEISEFNKKFAEFESRNTTLYGASTDSEFVHLAWRNNHNDLRGLKFPLIADTSKSLAENLGILESNEKVAYRVTFIVDSEGIIRWVNANDLSVGRNVDEVIRALSALQTGALTPCNWEPGQATL